MIQALLTLLRTHEHPSYGAIFLLNNMAYLRTQLLVKRADVTAMLARPTRDLLDSNLHIAEAGYFDVNFSPLVQTLTDEEATSQSDVNNKLNRFFKLLDEVAAQHESAKVLMEDPCGRTMVATEAVRMVVPSLRWFIQRSLVHEWSKCTNAVFV